MDFSKMYDSPVNLINHSIIDEAMIIRIGRGDDANALTQLYEATERAVYAYILSIMQTPEVAADLVQETYLCVRRSAHLYVPTGKPLVWLLSIARKLTNDYFRVHKRVSMNVRNLNADSTFDCITDITDRIILRHALGALRADERQVLFLHAVAGLRHREIAACLSIPISSVLTRYKRSVIKLQRHLNALGVSI